MGEKTPNDARMMGGFLFLRYLQKERSEDYPEFVLKRQSQTAIAGIADFSQAR